MTKNATSYSPNIQIYLEVGNQRIRLADVLFETATLFERATIPPKTLASLVVSIDGIDEREEILLENGIADQDSLVKFKYTGLGRLNGRSYLNTI